MTSPDTAPAELSKIVSLSDIGSGAREYALTASPSECKAAADRLKIPAVHALSGHVRVKASRAIISVSGDVTASLTRECVASLEELHEDVHDIFDFELVRGVEPTDSTGDDGDEIDLTEYHDGDELDVGDILVQQLALAMDPFPRKEGAPSLAETYGKQAEESPFQALSEAFKKNE